MIAIWNTKSPKKILIEVFLLISIWLPFINTFSNFHGPDYSIKRGYGPPHRDTDDGIEKQTTTSKTDNSDPLPPDCLMSTL